MKLDMNLNWQKKLKILHNRLIRRVEKSEVSKEVRKWIISYSNLLVSKNYIASNIDDLLWFYKNGLSQKDKILDFGTGGGYISYLISDITKNIIAYEYKGTWADQNYTNLTYYSAFTFAHKIINELEPQIKFIFYEKLPLKEKDKTFDGIVLYAVIEHIDSKIRDAVLKELYRILKPNGFLYIAKLPRLFSYQEFISRQLKLPCHTDLYTKDKINNLLSKHSFKIIRIQQTGLSVNYMNELFPIFSLLEKIFQYTPINFFSHDYRLIAQKI